MVHQTGQSWETALAVCLLTSLVTLVCTVLWVSERVMDLIPDSIKLGTVVGMGLLLAMIGFQSIGLVVADELSLVRLGDLSDWRIWLSLGGLIFILALTEVRIKGAMLFGIVGVTLISWTITDGWPQRIATVPFPLEKTLGHLDFGGLTLRKSLPGLVAFIFVGLFDVAAVMYGVARLVFGEAGQRQDDGRRRKRNIPGAYWVFIATGVGSLVAAVLGCSPIIVHIESAAGVKVGGRTGLTAVVTGVLFGLSLFFSPLFQAVPEVATAPVLILVGCLMLGECIRVIQFERVQDAIPAFLTIILMPFTFSIPTGLFFGLASYAALWVTLRLAKGAHHSERSCAADTDDEADTHAQSRAPADADRDQQNEPTTNSEQPQCDFHIRRGNGEVEAFVARAGPLLGSRLVMSDQATPVSCVSPRFLGV